MKRRLAVLAIGSILVILPVTGIAGFGDLLKQVTDTFLADGLTNEDIVQGLKEALEVGTGNAVSTAGRRDGYLGNPAIRIPLPGPVAKVETALRIAGFGDTVDNFVTSMNRAAEKAAPEAKSIFWDALREMTFSDARQILNGREDEATLYFKDKTSAKLSELFKPMVHDAMGDVGVTRSYQELDARVRSLPFADQLAFDLDQYVTDRAMDGLFHLLAEEESKIRTNPAARTTELLKKVFGRS